MDTPRESLPSSRVRRERRVHWRRSQSRCHRTTVSGVRLYHYQCRAPLPPGVGEQDPEHPINRPEPRALAAAFQRPELLPEREVLEHQFVMSAARQGERSDEKENHLQHATDPVYATRRKSTATETDSVLANDTGRSRTW
jgi:hypothetical protein